MKRRHIALFIILVACTVSCSKKMETGPSEIRWDRATCARCSMAISDRYYAAQVRGAFSNKERGLYLFDDLGCAVIWLDDQSWKSDASTEIWVNHHETGSWLDARIAWYVTEKQTPMDYGLGAQDEPAEGALNFEAAGAHMRNRR